MRNSAGKEGLDGEGNWGKREVVGLLVKEQFKVKGVETFMGLVMTLEGPVC
jgi:hypothetical protein